jgi:hypothetical protein
VALCCPPKVTGFRVFLCSVVNKRMHLFKGDVTKAFTQSALDVDMYIEQMDGYVEGGLQGDGRPNKVVYIEKGKGKAIEGLVQSGHSPPFPCLTVVGRERGAGTSSTQIVVRARE